MRSLVAGLLASFTLLAGGCGDDREGTSVSPDELPTALRSVADSLDAAAIDYAVEVLRTPPGDEERVGLIANPDTGAAVVIHDGGIAAWVTADGIEVKTSIGCKGFMAGGDSGQDVKQVLNAAQLC